MLIIASIGLNSTPEDKIKKIILAGADIIRYNFAHRVLSDNIEYVRNGKRIIEELHAGIKVMIDLPNNKVRLGHFNNIIHPVNEGQELTLKSAPFSPDCNEFIPIETKKIGNELNPDQTVTIGDGEVAIQILEIVNEDTVKARALNNGVIKSMKSFNAQLYFDDENYLKYCRDILEKIKELEPEYLVIPYLNEKIHKQIMELIKINKINSKIAIKIENKISENKIKEFYNDNSYQFVTIDLGELGVNMPFEQMGKFYNSIISNVKRHQKTLVMTHILESSIYNYVPNRSEIINLTNMVVNGIKGIILCHETNLGIRPAYTIHTAKKIISEAQK